MRGHESGFGDDDSRRRLTPHAEKIKRVILPSGKEVDVVSFTYIRSEVVRPEVSEPICSCPNPNCGHDRVQPTGWSEVDSSHWHVNLRCPDCEERRAVIINEDELDEFDVALDEGTRSMASDLDLLARANMADDIDSFTKALEGGHILPEDF